MARGGERRAIVAVAVTLDLNDPHVPGEPGPRAYMDGTPTATGHAPSSTRPTMQALRSGGRTIRGAGKVVR
eukprot:294169-Lingulodinium_polyedra.AAC.1